MKTLLSFSIILTAKLRHFYLYVIVVIPVVIERTLLTIITY